MTEEDATWEEGLLLRSQFPDLSLEDKALFDGGGDDRSMFVPDPIEGDVLIQWSLLLLMKFSGSQISWQICRFLPLLLLFSFVTASLLVTLLPMQCNLPRMYKVP